MLIEINDELGQALINNDVAKLAYPKKNLNCGIGEIGEIKASVGTEKHKILMGAIKDVKPLNFIGVWVMSAEEIKNNTQVFDIIIKDIKEEKTIENNL